MIKTGYETKVEQMKDFFRSNKNNVLNYNVTHGWLQPERKVKVLEVYDNYVKVGIVNSRGTVSYPECINYSSLIEKENTIIELAEFLGEGVVDGVLV